MNLEPITVILQQIEILKDECTDFQLNVQLVAMEYETDEFIRIARDEVSNTDLDDTLPFGMQPDVDP